MPFESFAKDDPTQIVLGLFSPELLAVYMFSQIGENLFDCHFTSRKDAPKDAVLSGACRLVQFFAENGVCLQAWVAGRNKPLKRWVESAGFDPVEIVPFSGLSYLRYSTQKRISSGCATIPSGETFHQLQDGTVNGHRTFRQKTNL